MYSEIVIKFKKPMNTEYGALGAASAALTAVMMKTTLPDDVEDVQLGTNVTPGEFLPPTVKHPDAI